MKTVSDVVDTFADTTARRGRGYTYEKTNGACFYRAADGSPSCAVGDVLDRWGVLDSIICDPGWDPDDNNHPDVWFENNTAAVSELDLHGCHEITDRPAVSLLTLIQAWQDNGVAYGIILDAIREVQAGGEDPVGVSTVEGQADVLAKMWTDRQVAALDFTPAPAREVVMSG